MAVEVECLLVADLANLSDADATRLLRDESLTTPEPVHGGERSAR
jgi:hypothetical protein